MIHTKNFINKQLERAGYGLLYRDKTRNLVFTYVREDGGGISDTYKLKYNYQEKLGTAIRSSWNGLTLECEKNGDITNVYHYITNVLTGQVSRLPACPYYSPDYKLCGMGYDAASMTYKVVISSLDESTVVYRCAILTVGVDKSWRIVPTDHLSWRGKRNLVYYHPITTEGFVHWKGKNNATVVTLNLETEIITESVPPKVEKRNSRTWSLSTGRYLSLFVQSERWAWEVYEMNPETREWRKFADICLEGQHGRIKRLGFEQPTIEPFGWLKYPEVLAFTVNYVVIIFYNLITYEIGAEMLSARFCARVTLHKNSLVWLGAP